MALALVMAAVEATLLKASVLKPLWTRSGSLGMAIPITALAKTSYTLSATRAATPGMRREFLFLDLRLNLIRNGWGASAVDALSTALVMGQSDIVRQITDFIPTIDYSMSIPNESVSLFETTIRYLGGMLSGYDLLTGPLASYNIKV